MIVERCTMYVKKVLSYTYVFYYGILTLKYTGHIQVPKITDSDCNMIQ